MTTANVVFLIVLILASGFFAYSAQRLYAFATGVGKADDRTNDPARRLWNFLTIGLAQTKILRDPVAGAMHALVFWGFCVITAGTAEMMVQGVWGGFGYAKFLPGPIYGAFALSQELFALLVWGAVSYLIYRRLVIKPRRLQGDGVETREAVIILTVIAVLMFTLLLTNAMEAVIEPAMVSGTPGYGRVVGHLLGLGLGHVVSPETALAVRNVSWWTHAILVLGFLNYLPFSKHLHVLVSLPNTYLSNTEGPGAEGRDALHGSRGRDRGVVRGERRRAADVEKPARRLFVHAVWALHGRVPGQPHGQAALAPQDRRQCQAAADGEGAARRA